MKVTRRELVDLIKEELSALFNEARLTRVPGREGEYGATGGGGTVADPTTDLDVPSKWSLKSRGITAPTEMGFHHKNPNLGWAKRPVSKPGGAPIEHPGVAQSISRSGGTDTITGQLPLRTVDIDVPADPIERPEDFPKPVDEAFEEAIQQAVNEVLQNLGK